MLTTVTTALASSPAPDLPGFLNVVGTYLERYGYWSIVLLVMLEDFGIPVPGETILIAAAIFAGAGRLNVVAVGVVGFVAAVIGDNIGFAIGHVGGRALALRWGRYVFLTEKRLAKAEVFFNRHGGKIIVVARFIEGLRQANGIIAGISGMRWLRFVVFNMLGAALWVGTWVSLGYLAGNHIGTVYSYITRYSYYVLIAVTVLLAAYITGRVLRRRHRAGEQPGERPGRQPREETGKRAGRQSREQTGRQPGRQPREQTEEQAGEQKAAEPQSSLEIQENSGTQGGFRAIERSGAQEGASSEEISETHNDPGIQEDHRILVDSKIQDNSRAAGPRDCPEGPGIRENTGLAEPSPGIRENTSLAERSPGIRENTGLAEPSPGIRENTGLAEPSPGIRENTSLAEPSPGIRENTGAADRPEP